MSRSEDMVGAFLQQNSRLRRVPGIEQAAKEYWGLEAAWWALEARRWGSTVNPCISHGGSAY